MPPALASVQLVCFGPPAILMNREEAPREARWQKHLAFLIYLSLSPHQRRSRDHLIGVFWAENQDLNARRALNEAVRKLRKALGAGRLRSEGDVLVLSDDDLDVDALRFAALVHARPDDALALMSGDFLEGFHLKGAREFDEWMAMERQRYQELAVGALVTSGERRLNAGDTMGAATAAHRALTLAPRSDRAMSLLMRAKAFGGEPGAAVAAFREFADQLKRETGESPAPALAGLADRLRKQEISAPRPKATELAAEPPLVGRKTVHRAVFECTADGLVNGPQVTAITSAPGMGRTRLLAECASRLAIDGALVLSARCIEADQDARWSVLRMLSRAGLAGAPGLSGARPDSLAVLASLDSALAERYAPRDARDVADMSAALTDLFGAVAEERPLALLIDDAHWADGPSLAALAAAIAALERPTRVVLALTAGEGVGRPTRELVRLRSEIGRSLQGCVARLEALTQEDNRELVASLAPWTRDQSESDRLARRITAESGGIPLLAVTLLRALGTAASLRAQVLVWPPPEQTFEAALPFSIPSLLKRALELALGELQQEQQDILAVASVCGDPFDTELIAHTVERSVADVERALAICEAHKLIHFMNGRYTFCAAVVADVVRAECVIAGERRRLERRASEFLASRADLPSRVLRVELLAHAAPERTVSQQALALASEAEDAGMAGAARRARAAAQRAARDAPP